jgi:hypothetical protein
LSALAGGGFVELDRNRENSFCCGAGGAQFWKEEEPGKERISENRYREVKQKLQGANSPKVLATGCPFCKSMLTSTPGKTEEIAVRDIAELLWQGIDNTPSAQAGEEPDVVAISEAPTPPLQSQPMEAVPGEGRKSGFTIDSECDRTPKRKKWTPSSAASGTSVPQQESTLDDNPAPASDAPIPRKPWKPKA